MQHNIGVVSYSTLIILWLFLSGCCSRDDWSPSFAQDIASIMSKHCVECHGAEDQEAGLDLRSVESILSGGESGPAIVAGQPENSLLLDMIHDEHMPPEGELLSAGDIDLLRRWVAAGARP